MGRRGPKIGYNTRGWKARVGEVKRVLRMKGYRQQGRDGKVNKTSKEDSRG